MGLLGRPVLRRPAVLVDLADPSVARAIRTSTLARPRSTSARSCRPARAGASGRTARASWGCADPLVHRGLTPENRTSRPRAASLGRRPRRVPGPGRQCGGAGGRRTGRCPCSPAGDPHRREALAHGGDDARRPRSPFQGRRRREVVEHVVGVAVEVVAVGPASAPRRTSRQHLGRAVAPNDELNVSAAGRRTPRRIWCSSVRWPSPTQATTMAPPGRTTGPSRPRRGGVGHVVQHVVGHHDVERASSRNGRSCTSATWPVVRR